MKTHSQPSPRATAPSKYRVSTIRRPVGAALLLLWRWLSGKSPVAFADIAGDLALFTRAGLGSDRLAFLRIESMRADHPITLYGLGVRLQQVPATMCSVFVASNTGYELAGKLLPNEGLHDFLQVVAARTVINAGEKWKPGLWTWQQITPDAKSPRQGRPMGCLPDAVFYVSQRVAENWQLVHAGNHAFAIWEDKRNKSVWVWPGAGFAAKECYTQDVRTAVEQVFKFQVSGINYLKLPK